MLRTFKNTPIKGDINRKPWNTQTKTKVLRLFIPLAKINRYHANHTNIYFLPEIPECPWCLRCLSLTCGKRDKTHRTEFEWMHRNKIMSDPGEGYSWSKKLRGNHLRRHCNCSLADSKVSYILWVAAPVCKSTFVQILRSPANPSDGKCRFLSQELQPLTWLPLKSEQLDCILVVDG